MFGCGNRKWERFQKWYEARHGVRFSPEGVPVVNPVATPVAAVPVKPRWKPGHTLAFCILVAPILVGGIIGTTAIVTYHERCVRQMEQDAALKMEMIAKGMSAAEIDMVLRASSADDGRPGADYYRNTLVRDLRKQGLKADEIEKIVKAAYPGYAASPPTKAVAVGKQATAKPAPFDIDSLGLAMPPAGN